MFGAFLLLLLSVFLAFGNFLCAFFSFGHLRDHCCAFLATFGAFAELFWPFSGPLQSYSVTLWGSFVLFAVFFYFSFTFLPYLILSFVSLLIKLLII